MSGVKSRKRTGIQFSARLSPTSPAKKCECCGKIVVLLRAIRYDGTPYWKKCYIKGWDGNPLWSAGTAVPHPKKRFGVRIWKAPERSKLDDSLD